jgi:hypothetical protein
MCALNEETRTEMRILEEVLHRIAKIGDSGRSGRRRR